MAFIFKPKSKIYDKHAPLYSMTGIVPEWYINVSMLLNLHTLAFLMKINTISFEITIFGNALKLNSLVYKRDTQYKFSGLIELSFNFKLHKNELRNLKHSNLVLPREGLLHVSRCYSAGTHVLPMYFKFFTAYDIYKTKSCLSPFSVSKREHVSVILHQVLLGIQLFVFYQSNMTCLDAYETVKKGV